MMRRESKIRARTLQLLYLVEAGGDPNPDHALRGLARLTGPEPAVLDQAREFVGGILAREAELDRLAAEAAENWRVERLGTIERNILRLGIDEMLRGETSAKIVIDEAVWLAQRFAGPRAPAFVNGVLDRVARTLGRL